MKRSLTITIVLFWCLMNILLLRRQLWAPPPPILLHTVDVITEPMEEWWGIYYRGEKIGYATQKVTPEPEGYRVQSSSILRLNLLGTSQTVKTRLEMVAASNWTLKQFDFELHSNNVRFKVRGKVAGRRLQLEVDSGGHRTKKDLPLSQPPYLLVALKPYIVTQNFEPGKEHLFPTFDPSTLSQQITTVTVEGRERIKIGGKMEPAIRIRQRFKGISVISWVDGKGRTLKEETPMGLSLVRQGPKEAKILSERSIPLDLIAQTAVPLESPIIDPAQKNLLKLKLSGFKLANFSLSTGRQRLSEDILEIRREDLNQLHSYRIPNQEPRFASYLQSTPFLQSDHPQIRALVQRVLKGETDALKAVTRIREWVYDGLAKEPTVSIPNALEVLQTKKGDCNEHTVLFNAMARAVGIPAKTVVGVVYLRGAFYYHAWSEVWLGKWVSLDSVLNQFPADVTHVKFLEGEIDRQIDILQLIGKLTIQVVEAS
ncbi:MAG: transglutaminase-like domain-containing protein [Deltaproteobacteria bacterium]|nr:transglutaminase-like domain-containing protein [Deltaproteobacteria bacterium]